MGCAPRPGSGETPFPGQDRASGFLGSLLENSGRAGCESPRPREAARGTRMGRGQSPAPAAMGAEKCTQQPLRAAVLVPRAGLLQEQRPKPMFPTPSLGPECKARTLHT